MLFNTLYLYGVTPAPDQQAAAFRAQGIDLAAPYIAKVYIVQMQQLWTGCRYLPMIAAPDQQTMLDF